MCIRDSASTVRSRLARGLERLRDELNRRHPGGEAEWLSALLPLAFPGAVSAALSPGVPAPALAHPVVANIAVKKVSLVATLAFTSVLGVVGLRSLGFGGAFQRGNSGGHVMALAPRNSSLDELPGHAATLELVAPTEGTPGRTLVEGAGTQPASVETAHIGESHQLAGRVTLLDGTPVTGVTIGAKPSDDKDGLTTGHCDLDVDGRFVIEGLGMGSYDLRLAHHWDLPGAYRHTGSRFLRGHSQKFWLAA